MSPSRIRFYRRKTVSDKSKWAITFSILIDIDDYSIVMHLWHDDAAQYNYIRKTKRASFGKATHTTIMC